MWRAGMGMGLLQMASRVTLESPQELSLRPCGVVHDSHRADIVDCTLAQSRAESCSSCSVRYAATVPQGQGCSGTSRNPSCAVQVIDRSRFENQSRPDSLSRKFHATLSLILTPCTPPFTLPRSLSPVSTPHAATANSPPAHLCGWRQSMPRRLPCASLDLCAAPRQVQPALGSSQAQDAASMQCACVGRWHGDAREATPARGQRDTKGQ